MLRKEEQKYLLDILAMMDEIDLILNKCQRDFNQFASDFIFVRALERDLMIIGEAVNKLKRMNPSIKLQNEAHIIGLRNLIVHAYDAIEPTALWKIALVDLPLLKIEINAL